MDGSVEGGCGCWEEEEEEDIGGFVFGWWCWLFVEV